MAVGRLGWLSVQAGLAPAPLPAFSPLVLSPPALAQPANKRPPPCLLLLQPPAVTERGPAVPFLGGLPLVFLPPELPGFQRLPGRNQFAYAGGSFACSASIK